MRVETYSDQYFEDVVTLVQNFHAEAVGEYDCQFDPATVVDTITSADKSNAFLLIIDDKCQGLLYGTRSKSFFNQGDVFQEVMWYVNPPYRRYGIKLLRMVENLLKSTRVSIMIMAVLENSKTEKLKQFYSRLGFKPMETHYMRAL